MSYQYIRYLDRRSARVSEVSIASNKGCFAGNMLLVSDFFYSPQARTTTACVPKFGVMFESHVWSIKLDSLKAGCHLAIYKRRSLIGGSILSPENTILVPESMLGKE